MSWEPLLLFVVPALVLLDIVGRYRQQRVAANEIGMLFDEVKGIVRRREGGIASAEDPTRETELYTSIENLMWELGFDFRGTVAKLEADCQDRHGVCQRLLEINAELKSLPSSVSDNCVADSPRRCRDALYAEAERLLPELGVDAAQLVRNETGGLGTLRER